MRQKTRIVYGLGTGCSVPSLGIQQMIDIQRELPGSYRGSSQKLCHIGMLDYLLYFQRLFPPWKMGNVAKTPIYNYASYFQ